MAILTSAGDPGHWSHRILETAYESERWRVNEVPGPTPWIDADELEEQEGILPEWEYRRLHLNEWTAADDRITTLEAIRACITLDEPQEPRKGNRYVAAVDIGLVKDQTVVSVMHKEGDRVILDRQAVWQGSKDNPVRLGRVQNWIAEAARQYRPCTTLADPWQAVQLLQGLEDEGHKVEKYTFSESSVGRLAVTLHQILKDRRLALYPDDDLITELANVRLIEKSPGSYKIDHDSDKHDDRAVSLALGAWWLVSRPEKRRVDPSELGKALGDANRGFWRRSIRPH